MYKTFFLTSLGGLLCACAASQGPVFSYNEIAIVNQSRAQVSDVTISATDSAGMFSCGNIAPRGICSDSFPPRPYRDKPIRISWVIANGTRRSRVLDLPLPPNAVPGIPLRGVLVISARGDISAYLQQDPPGPHL